MEDNISPEAEALRRRHPSTILLVIQDADELSVDQIKSNLDAKLLSPRDDNEPIAYIIPKWHIQAWIAYLDGKDVNEADKVTDKNMYGKLSKAKMPIPLSTGLQITAEKIYNSNRRRILWSRLVKN